MGPCALWWYLCAIAVSTDVSNGRDANRCRHGATQAETAHSEESVHVLPAVTVEAPRQSSPSRQPEKRENNARTQKPVAAQTAPNSAALAYSLLPRALRMSLRDPPACPIWPAS